MGTTNRLIQSRINATRSMISVFRFPAKITTRALYFLKMLFEIAGLAIL